MKSWNNKFIFAYLRRWLAQCGTTSGSSQVRVDSSNTFPSPQEIRRGKPLTQVIRRPQSPGTGKRGYGQNFAATVLLGTFVGHLKPITAENSYIDYYTV